MAEKKYSKRADSDFVVVHSDGPDNKRKIPVRDFEDALVTPYKDSKGRRYELPPTGGSTYVGLDAPEFGGYEAGAGRGQVNPVKGKDFAKGGSVKSSASRRADGIAQRGKTRGKMV